MQHNKSDNDVCECNKRVKKLLIQCTMRNFQTRMISENQVCMKRRKMEPGLML